MLSYNNYKLLRSNEHFLDTCCSFNEKQRIYLSCGLNEKIRLNLIEIFYNSNPYCSSRYSCCKYRTDCSRRITKYSNLKCDDKNSCWIDKTCLKIYKPCANIYGLYGQYITINYSCVSSIQTYDIKNRTDYFFSNKQIPFIVKVLSSERTTVKNLMIKKNFFIPDNNFKSSPLFLISVIVFFLILMSISYYIADQIGKKVRHPNHLKKNLKTRKVFLKNTTEEKARVEINRSIPVTRIYPYTTIYEYRRPYFDSNNHYIPYRTFVNIEHDPTTGHFYSRTYNPYFNH